MKKEKLTRRDFLKSAGLFTLGGLAAACTPQGTPVPSTTQSAAPVTAAPAAAAIKGSPLEVGVLWSEGTTYYDLVTKIGDGLAKDYPGTQMTYTFANTKARPAIETRTRAGNPLDVDNIYDGMDPNTLDWASNGYLYDLTPAMTAVREDGTTWKSDFNTAFLPAMSYQDKIYAAPDQLWYFVIHYNKKMLDGWGMKPPTTWAELLDMSEQIKAKGVAPFTLAGQSMAYISQWWDHLLLRMVGPDKVLDYLYGDNDSKLADDPVFLTAAQELNKLSKNNYLVEGWQGTDFTTAQVYFFQGKSAMILMGSWLATEMKDSIPPDFTLAVSQFPKVEGYTVPDTILGHASSWSVMSKSKNPDLAIEYLKRFTSKDICQVRTDTLGVISPMEGAPAPSSIAGMDKVISETKNFRVVNWYYSLVTAKFGLKEAWRSPIQEMMIGSLEPAAAIAKIDSGLAAVREQRKAS